jgi:anti-anti-sigma factor
MSDIALAFADSSYLCSRTIGVLVECSGLIASAKGSLAIVGPSKEMLDYLKTTSLDSLIRIVSSEEQLQD